MRQILFAADGFLAAYNAFQRHYIDFHSKPIQPYRIFGLSLECAKSVNTIEEIYQCVIA